PVSWDLKVFFICALLLSVSLLPVVPTTAHPRQAPASASSGPQVIKSEADLVVLPVTVTDRHGHSVVGLKQEDFHVYDDGKPQTIQLFMHNDAPVTAGLVIDCSGSMKENRDEVAAAAKDFLGSSNPQDQIFVVNFNETAHLGLPASLPFTGDVSQLVSAVETGPSKGLTALYDAVALGLRHLALGANQKKALIIVSDGGDDASYMNLKKILAAVQRSSTVIYTIGIVASDQANVDPGALKRMAKETGGQSYFPRSIEQLPGVSQQIARDLRQQYTIAFLPDQTARKAGFRKIRVTVKAPGHGGLKIRTRPGYLAGGSGGSADGGDR
ncbi:MAG: VWA domain-containing protein, partial [Candidatus Acidiferrales bacterium]